MNKLLKLCKKFKIRLTVKKNGKRVYKKVSVLKKQLKTKMRKSKKIGRKSKFGNYFKRTLGHFKRRKKEYGLALGVLGAAGAAHAAARHTRRGRRTMVEYNRSLDRMIARRHLGTVERERRIIDEMKNIGKEREKEDAERAAKAASKFGRKKSNKSIKTKKFNKLIKLCKKYKVKIGKKSFSKLRMDCMKKIKMLLKNV